MTDKKGQAMSSANILLRGQSNAELFGSEIISSTAGQETGLQYLGYVVNLYTHLNINFIYSSDVDVGGTTDNSEAMTGPYGPVYTAIGATGITPANGNTYWLSANGTADTANNPELNLYYGLNSLSSAVRALPLQLFGYGMNLTALRWATWRRTVAKLQRLPLRITVQHALL